VAFWDYKNASNWFYAGDSPHTPLGELTMLVKWGRGIPYLYPCPSTPSAPRPFDPQLSFCSRAPAWIVHGRLVHGLLLQAHKLQNSVPECIKTCHFSFSKLKTFLWRGHSPFPRPHPKREGISLGHPLDHAISI